MDYSTLPSAITDFDQFASRSMPGVSGLKDCGCNSNQMNGLSDAAADALFGLKYQSQLLGIAQGKYPDAATAGKMLADLPPGLLTADQIAALKLAAGLLPSGTSSATTPVVSSANPPATTDNTMTYVMIGGGIALIGLIIILATKK